MQSPIVPRRIYSHPWLMCQHFSASLAFHKSSTCLGRLATRHNDLRTARSSLRERVALTALTRYPGRTHDSAFFGRVYRFFGLPDVRRDAAAVTTATQPLLIMGFTPHIYLHIRTLINVRKLTHLHLHHIQQQLLKCLNGQTQIQVSTIISPQYCILVFLFGGGLTVYCVYSSVIIFDVAFGPVEKTRKRAASSERREESEDGRRRAVGVVGVYVYVPKSAAIIRPVEEAWT